MMSDDEKLTDYTATNEVIFDLRTPTFPCLENCFMFVRYLAKEHKCKQLLDLFDCMLRRVRYNKDDISLDEYINDEISEIRYKDLMEQAENYINNQNLQKRIDRAISIIENDANYDDSDFESRKFQEDILKALKGDNDGR